MTNSIRSPFPWFGGKGAPKIKDAILRLLPPHERYVEPFGGGASILIAKEPCKVEVYNDVNRGMVNFFRVIADADYFGKFMARAALLPYSREMYEEFLRPVRRDPRSRRAGRPMVLRGSAEFCRDFWQLVGDRSQHLTHRSLEIQF